MPRLHITANSNHTGMPYWSPEQLQSQHHAWLSQHYQRAGLRGELTWTETAATIVTEVQASRAGGDEPLLGLANVALLAVQSAALSPVDAVVTDVIRTWAATAAAAGITGLAAGKDAGPQIQAIAGLVGAVGGGIAGWFLKAEVPIYRLERDAYGRLIWVAVPLGSTAPVRLSFA